MVSAVVVVERRRNHQQQQVIKKQHRRSLLLSSSSLSSKRQLTFLFFFLLLVGGCLVKVASAFSHFTGINTRRRSTTTSLAANKLTSSADTSSSSSFDKDDDNMLRRGLLYNHHQQQQLIRRVAVVGGTHGNEYTGVWCVKALQAPLQQAELKRLYPSLEITTLISNPAAFEQNKRFVSSDLNREFSAKKLLDTNLSQQHNVEALRAREISNLLGPKFVVDVNNNSNNNTVLNPHPKTDLIVDLHTTTSNMGITLIINEGDVLMAQAAAHVMMKCQQQQQYHHHHDYQSSDNVNGNNIDNTGDSDPRGDSSSSSSSSSNSKVQVLMHSIPDRAKRPNVASTALHGFTIEVGPVPQGVLRHDVVLKTQRALQALLEFCQEYNRQLSTVAATTTTTTANSQNKDDDNGDNNNNNHSMLPLLLRAQLEEHYPDQLVPCYQSAPAVLPGEMSGKITWPVDDDHEDFPLYMIHESRQDADFHAISTGDALFVTRDGTTLPYTGSHGDLVHLMFINEGGYYYKSSGTGIGVAVTRHYDLRNGNIVKTVEDDNVDLNSITNNNNAPQEGANDEATTTTSSRAKTTDDKP